MSSTHGFAVGDLDDEVKDYSKLFKDHKDEDMVDDGMDMVDDGMDMVKVYHVEGTPMISTLNTPIVFSRTSPLDSLDSDCDEADGNDGIFSSSSSVSESTTGDFLGTVSPSDLPASPGDLSEETRPTIPTPKPPVPPKPVHLMATKVSAVEEKENPSSDSDDDLLLAEVIKAGIPKRRKKKVPEKKEEEKKDQKIEIKTDNQIEDSSVQKFESDDYLETDIDTVINYEKFLMNQKPSVFQYKFYQV